MRIVGRLILPAALALGVTTWAGPAPCMAEDGPPALDGTRYCANLSGMLGYNEFIRKGCLETEAKSEQRVRSLWSETPEGVRAGCIKSLAFVTPSYQALSGCMSLTVATMWINGELRLIPR